MSGNAPMPPPAAVPAGQAGEATLLLMTRLELSLSHGVTVEHIAALVREGILEPQGTGGAPDDWRFDRGDWQRTGVALRLERDLGLNLPGVALALQLLDEIDALRQQLAQR